MATRRELLLTAIAERLEGITIAAGYHTDAGELVRLGQDLDLAPADPAAAILVIAGLEKFDTLQTKLYSVWALTIRAVVKADLDDPWITAEELIGDIERAIEIEDRTYGGLINWNGDHGLVLESMQSQERAAGSAVVGMEALFLVKLQRAWGDPLGSAVPFAAAS